MMNFRKKYWVVSLSLLLSFSLVLPFCCHANMSKPAAQHQEMQSGATHGQHSDAQQCNCGHELVKDYQKTKKVVDSPSWLLSSAVELPDRLIFPVYIHFSSAPMPMPPGLLNDSVPPIHLLISVFLN